ncbi:MAG: class I SAM-dependent methyltransferase [Bacillota bacterium]
MAHQEQAASHYGSPNPLNVRTEIHRLYEEQKTDFDDLLVRTMGLEGSESVLDAGCGPGGFLLHLRQTGHRGVLVGVDQSSGMIAAALAESNRRGYEIGWVTGDVTRLPYPSDSFDWVVARHMLYHAEDIGVALSEFARLSNRLLVTTNSSRSLPRIFDLRATLWERFRLPPEQAVISRFCLENAEQQLQTVYSRVAPTVLTNALVFHEPEPIIRYIVSTLQALALPRERWIELEHWLATEVERRLSALGGIWRDPKEIALYRCDT